MTNVSAMVPKGKFSIAFCDTCFYLDASSRQIRIDYSNIRNIINIGSLEMKQVSNTVVALKSPLILGKRKLDCVCLTLDTSTPKETYFTDKKRKIKGKDYSIFITILKTKFTFSVCLLASYSISRKGHQTRLLVFHQQLENGFC